VSSNRGKLFNTSKKAESLLVSILKICALLGLNFMENGDLGGGQKIFG